MNVSGAVMVDEAVASTGVEVIAAEVIVSAPTTAASVLTAPSQSQWSSWGSQPYDSVGLGPRAAVSVSSSTAAVVTPASAVTAPSQCQWSPWGSQPYDSVGLGSIDAVSVASTAVVTTASAAVVVSVTAVAAASQCLLSG